jgi:hypothetical protein
MRTIGTRGVQRHFSTHTCPFCLAFDRFARTGAMSERRPPIRVQDFVNVYGSKRKKVVVQPADDDDDDDDGDNNGGAAAQDGRECFVPTRVRDTVTAHSVG